MPLCRKGPSANADRSDARAGWIQRIHNEQRHGSEFTAIDINRSGNPRHCNIGIKGFFIGAIGFAGVDNTRKGSSALAVASV